MVNAGSRISRIPLYHIGGGPSYPYYEAGRLRGHSKKKKMKKMMDVRVYECEWNWIK